jgi:2-polyprenyl-3-methyl-5-hydroxy-6-metoxy-1,4-benzoquinol methylase
MYSFKDLTKNLELKNNIYFCSKKYNLSYPKEDYDAIFQLEEYSFWFSHRNNCILNVIKNFSNFNTLIDLGGGNGYITKFLQENGYDSILLEPGREGIYNAKKRGVQKLICATINDLDISYNKFPNIGLFDVLEHIRNDSEFLKKIYNYLSPKSYLYITVPSNKFLWSYKDVLAQHYRRYSMRDIISKLEDIGFNVEYKSYFFSFLIMPIFIFRVIPSKFKKSDKILIGNKEEHSSSYYKLLTPIFNYELKMIKKKKKIPFGTSIIVVAKRKI